MAINFGGTITQSELNGIIALFCHFYEHHEDFEYSDEVIEFDTCDLQIINGIYSDEELIVEPPLKVKITNELFPCQNYYLGVNYYSYGPDDDNLLPPLQRGYFPLEVNDGIGEIDFNDEDVVYIMLDNWELVTKFDKPVIEEVTS